MHVDKGYANKNKPKRGQFWRKKDNGIVIEVTAVNGSKIKTRSASVGHREHVHSIGLKALHLFWERV